MIRLYPKNKREAESNLGAIFSTLFNPEIIQKHSFDKLNELLQKVLRFDYDFSEYTDQIITGVVSFYHQPLKVNRHIYNNITYY